MKENKNDPITVFSQFSSGTSFKAALGDKGISEQTEINNRFYIGDHWHGAKCGNDRPLVRRNIIRRIADYKLSSIGSAKLSVNFSAEGIAEGENAEKIASSMRLLTSYAASTMERLRFDSLAFELLKNAYISGTGIMYTYWDETAKTGLFTDAARTHPIRGDIACEVVDVENVVFGDPYSSDVQSQPYIIIAARKDIEAVRADAKRSGMSGAELEKIQPDSTSTDNRVTVLTKFYKEYGGARSGGRVMCVKCTENTVIRPAFDIGIGLYPISVMHWDTRRHCAYGESEITYLIPNQIAINRALSAEVWGLMLTGMPIMLQNGDIIPDELSNDPGQVVKVYGGEEDIAGALRFIQPPSFAGEMISGINDLASNTLSDLGANDAALGNIRPDNAAAVVQVREAALQPMQIKQNRYYAFAEECFRIWAAFWVSFFGERSLRITTKNGVEYAPFDSTVLRDVIINARVDVGASTVWSAAVVISTLDSMLKAGVITPIQYLERMPDGIIPDRAGIIEQLKTADTAPEEVQE